ncbi:hypothetical protein QAD02_001780 [Eretmocerus hayati]|uniref:Uncharacterized protein n=1 Tax=Eretmocerus hayati TaxID=131215 RepID=A0ACC2NHE6_9HYME|nr:hypothetical protein QAD02_001780 [Eretmocerus hayati]
MRKKEKQALAAQVDMPSVSTWEPASGIPLAFSANTPNQRNWFAIRPYTWLSSPRIPHSDALLAAVLDSATDRHYTAYTLPSIDFHNIESLVEGKSVHENRRS